MLVKTFFMSGNSQSGLSRAVRRPLPHLRALPPAVRGGEQFERAAAVGLGVTVGLGNGSSGGGVIGGRRAGKNRIMIFGPKADGTYVIEFKTAARARRWRSRSPGPRRQWSGTSRNVLPYGLFVPDIP
jgi:hypothetical protein